MIYLFGILKIIPIFASENIKQQTIKQKQIMKKEKVYPKVVLCDTMLNVTEKDVTEFNEMNDTNYDLYTVTNILREDEITDFFDNLRYCEYNENDFVIYGSVGMWNGRYNICPVVTSALDKAIYKCIKDCDNYSILLINGGLKITAYHHDGTNYFRVKMLNKKGITCRKGDITKTRYHQRIKGYLF